jgi:hypothetical protein
LEIINKTSIKTIQKYYPKVIVLSFSGNRKALSNTGIIVIVSVILVVVLGATVAYFVFWSNNLKTEEMEFSDFTAVEVSRAFEVKITKSNSYRVVISADK